MISRSSGHLSLLFPRKRESRISATQGRMPAFAATTCGADFWSEQRRAANAAKRFVSPGEATLLFLRALRFVRTGKRNGLGSALSKDLVPQGLAKRGGDGGLWAPSGPSFETRCEASLLRMRAWRRLGCVPFGKLRAGFPGRWRRLRAKSLGVPLKAAKVARKRS